MAVWSALILPRSKNYSKPARHLMRLSDCTQAGRIARKCNRKMVIDFKIRKRKLSATNDFFGFLNNTKKINIVALQREYALFRV